ncbi:MAG: heavy metal response regulator transcription factor [Xanthomonadaceae bacterium]|nr:heavy metal response regulator transcription factor [Xanthomonadaceae bacterium]
MRVLVAEDEAKARRYLAQGLHEQGFTVDVVEDGAGALTLLREHMFDVAILDVMMPGRDGWGVVQAMRAEGIRTPVLFLTARDHVEDRVRGFELGGDDYLVKPFAFAELLARVRNLVRRAEPSAEDGAIRIGDLLVDPMHHRIERAGRTLQCTPKEYALLLLLARHQGRVLSRTLIAESVWGVCFETQTNVVDVVVKRLRAKLDAPFASPLLHTVRGVGYVLDAHAD